MATSSPEYQCAVIDWLSEGLALPVLRQPYNLDQLPRTVALTAYGLETRQRSALRLLPPRQMPAPASSLLPPLAAATAPVADEIAAGSLLGCA